MTLFQATENWSKKWISFTWKKIGQLRFVWSFSGSSTVSAVKNNRFIGSLETEIKEAQPQFLMEKPFNKPSRQLNHFSETLSIWGCINVGVSEASVLRCYKKKSNYSMKYLSFDWVYLIKGASKALIQEWIDKCSPDAWNFSTAFRPKIESVAFLGPFGWSIN